MCTRILALFSSVPYSPPINTDTDTLDLRPHLTNTSLQTHRGEEGVFLFDELHGCTVLSPQDAEGQIKFGEKDTANILDQMCEILADTFRAAMEHPVHFQASPFINTFFVSDCVCSLCPMHSNCLGSTSCSQQGQLLHCHPQARPWHLWPTCLRSMPSQP